MSYSHYQKNLPGWGTSQFQFGPPPALNFQPQASWTGIDYYNAHAPNPQPEVYQYAMNRLLSGAGALGIGMHEARYWHRRAYGGVGDITRMLPSEIGHAAAYEAYRAWIHNSPAFRVMDGDFERQKEVLISIAIAESAHLWEATGRGFDQYALQTASETAAATASLIFSQTMDLQSLGTDYYRARGSQYYPNASDAYSMDDMALMNRQQQMGGMGLGLGQGGMGTGGGMGMGMGGNMGAGGGMGMGRGPGMAGGMMGGGIPRPLSAEPYPRYPPSPYVAGATMSQPGLSPYAGTTPYTGSAGMTPYAGGVNGMGGMGGMGGGYSQYANSVNTTYPGVPLGSTGTYGGGAVMGSGGYGSGYGGYGGNGAGYGGVYGQQQPTVILERGREPHHHHHHHRRYRSLSRY